MLPIQPRLLMQIPQSNDFAAARSLLFIHMV